MADFAAFEYSKVEIPLEKFSHSAGQDQKKKSDSCWFEFHRIYFNFTYHLAIAPFRFKKKDDGQFSVYSTRIQTGLCFLLQFASSLYIRTTFVAGWDWVKAGEDRLSYFDLLFLVLLFGFDISMKSTLWYQRDAFVSIYDELQHSPLLNISSSWSPLMVKLLISTICSIYLIPSVFYIALVLGVNLSDVDGLLSGIDTHANTMFNFVPEFWTNLTILKVFAVFITIYTSAFWHYSDVLVLTSTLLFHRLSSDFFSALENGQIPDSEVIMYFDAYRRLNRKFNKAVGLLCCVFLTYPLSYYATHLVDMLNDSELMNRFSMTIYLGNLSLSLILGAKINYMAKCVKVWVRKEHEKQRISIQRLSLILYELRNEQIGINGGFCISMGFAGEIVNLLLTLAIVTIQFKM